MVIKKTLLRCYAIIITLVALCLVGTINQDTKDYTTVPTEEPTITNDPLPSRSMSPIDAGVWKVVQVVDGDTLVVGDSTDRTKQYRVRLIGTDTPETVRSGSPVEAFGMEASDFTKQMIAKADHRIRISFDGEQLDRFGRTLAMVWLQLPNGQEVWLNELLIREGLAHARLDYRYSHGAKLAFAVAELEARKQRRNLWKDTIQ